MHEIQTYTSGEKRKYKRTKRENKKQQTTTEIGNIRFRLVFFPCNGPHWFSSFHLFGFGSFALVYSATRDHDMEYNVWYGWTIVIFHKNQTSSHVKTDTETATLTFTLNETGWIPTSSVRLIPSTEKMNNKRMFTFISIRQGGWNDKGMKTNQNKSDYCYLLFLR